MLIGWISLFVARFTVTPAGSCRKTGRNIQEYSRIHCTAALIDLHARIALLSLQVGRLLVFSFPCFCRWHGTDTAWSGLVCRMPYAVVWQKEGDGLLLGTGNAVWPCVLWPVYCLLHLILSRACFKTVAQVTQPSAGVLYL